MIVLDDEMCMNYERMVCNAFNCSRLQYRFADIGFCRNANEHPEVFVVILECALISLANRHDGNESDLRALISRIDSTPTLACAEEIITEMDQSGIIY